MISAAAVPTLAGSDPAARAERRQVAEVRIGHEDDRATRTPVTAVGTASRDVLLAAEAERAVAATAGDDVDAGTVVEHRDSKARGRASSGLERRRLNLGVRHRVKLESGERGHRFPSRQGSSAQSCGREVALSV